MNRRQFLKNLGAVAVSLGILECVESFAMECLNVFHSDIESYPEKSGFSA